MHVRKVGLETTAQCHCVVIAAIYYTGNAAQIACVNASKVGEAQIVLAEACQRLACAPDAVCAQKANAFAMRH